MLEQAIEVIESGEITVQEAINEYELMSFEIQELNQRFGYDV